MKVPTPSQTSSGGFGTEFGDSVHKSIQKLLNNKAKITDFEGNKKTTLENALATVEDLAKQFPGLKLESTEMPFLPHNLSISEITNYNGDLILDGKIDAVFTHDKGVLIVDWKTDKDVESKYKQQVAFYKKVYSKIKNIPEEDITICVAYISLRGSVSTGKLDRELDFVKRGDPYETFENHLKIILGWIDDPKKFIDDLLLVKNHDEPLLDIVKSLLVPT